MTKEEAKRFGLQLLQGIMERNESYPVYANNVKQAIDALSETSGSSETPNDLEEAVEKQINEALFKWSYDDEDGIEQYVHDAFIAGAKWQADNTPLPEDTVLFNKGVDEGKRLMMEEAVEGVVCYGSKGAYIETDFLGEYNTDVYGNPGDKVRVIVCKKED